MQYAKKFVIVLALALSMGSVSFAHEGHDAAPGAIKASHGGIVKPGKEINLEYVVSGNEVAFYPVTHEGKDLAANEVKITATAKTPKGKAENLKVDSQGGVLKTMVDFKGAYRAEVVVNADHMGKKDSFKFQVEKQ